jgi:hypothetical protein
MVVVVTTYSTPKNRNLFLNDDLGSTIPGPAFQICMRATLAVKLGNAYGISYDAQPYADKLLKSLSPDRWSVYLSKFLASDEMIIEKLTNERPAQKWVELVTLYNLASFSVQDGKVKRLVQAAADDNLKSIRSNAQAIFRTLM